MQCGPRVFPYDSEYGFWGTAAQAVALWGCACNFESACSVGAGYVAVPLPHGGDSVC